MIMYSFKPVAIPNLPQNKALHCLIGSENTAESNELTQLGIIPLGVTPNPKLDDEIRSHADMLTFNLGNGKLLTYDECVGELLKGIPSVACEVITKAVKSPYPDDIPLNAAFIGDKIICNKNYVAKEIIDFAECNNIKLIHTNQGYSKCSICVVNENAVITDDDSITTLLNNCQIDVLKIRKGEIYLSDKHYGFIGGASAKLSRDIMYFSGNIKKHSNYNEIIGFLRNYGIYAEFNSQRALKDFGGLIQLTESE